MSDNNQSRISFTKNMLINWSARGYVDVVVRGTGIQVSRSLSCDRKAEIEKMYQQEPAEVCDAVWQKEMHRLEDEAVAEAKRLFKARDD